VYNYVITITDGEESDDGKNWRTYEEAELACLKKLIEIVKNK
jgi:transketolase N-terminal domain/subunit